MTSWRSAGCTSTGPKSSIPRYGTVEVGGFRHEPIGVPRRLDARGRVPPQRRLRPLPPSPPAQAVVQLGANGTARRRSVAGPRECSERARHSVGHGLGGQQQAAPHGHRLDRGRRGRHQRHRPQRMDEQGQRAARSPRTAGGFRRREFRHGQARTDRAGRRRRRDHPALRQPRSERRRSAARSSVSLLLAKHKRRMRSSRPWSSGDSA